MIIIGEKINRTIPSVKNAIEQKDEELIRNLSALAERVYSTRCLKKLK